MSDNKKCFRLYGVKNQRGWLSPWFEFTDTLQEIAIYNNIRIARRKATETLVYHPEYGVPEIVRLAIFPTITLDETGTIKKAARKAIKRKIKKLKFFLEKNPIKANQPYHGNEDAGGITYNEKLQDLKEQLKELE